jgi:hypothetical protein
VQTLVIKKRDTQIIILKKLKTIKTMKKEIELKLNELGVTKVNKNVFNEIWHILYDTLLNKYGISSNEADKELNLYFNQLN